MEYKSNITVASNIFNRVSGDVKNDPNFVHNCRGGVALTELHNRLQGTLINVRLSNTQDRERTEDKGCSLADDKQMTHGPVRCGSSIEWECRCEYDSCPRFSECMPNPIIREHNNIVPVSTSDYSNLKYEWLGAIIPLEHLYDEPELEIEEEPIPEEYVIPSVAFSSEYVPLTDPSAIITASIDTHILVNAGPGTGKTYTVIERLSHIIRSGNVELGQVLVLCYTNAARDVILQRLTDKGLGEEARQLVICTLDSLAWQNLIDRFEDESQISELFALGYNGCIKKFNAEFNSDEWSLFEYVIIDELQDLVNERAEMALKILEALCCGYLLLGDRCQAIYDYDCDGIDKVNSVMFYDRINATIPSDAMKYELIGNHRQSTDLSRNSNDYREALLVFNPHEANQYFRDQINEIPSRPFSPDDFIVSPKTGTTAILTRNNGEAEWVSAQLHKNNVPHNLLRSVTPQVSLHRWLADMFWDYREPRISREDFIERYLVRICDNDEAAKNAYDAIVSFLPEEQNILGYFNLKDLNAMLKRGHFLSPFLLNIPCKALTVSTIHKAKGCEFDHVYLLGGFNPSESNTEEARVWYVGATRPKSVLDCAQKGKWYVRKSSTNRWLWQGFSPWTKSKFCDKIVVGLREDIEQSGFVAGDLEQAVQRQSYIAGKISINDRVELFLVDGVYQVFHNGFCIGTLSDDARVGLLNSIRSLYRWSDIPPHLSDIYVNNIISVVPYHFPSGVDAMFKESNFWLGVELTGFAKANWNRGGK